MAVNLFSKYAGDYLETISLDIQNNAPQTFTHKFSNGRVFNIYLRYNNTLDNWVLDIYEQLSAEDIKPVVLGIILQYGLDLLSQYKYLGLGELYVFSKNPPEFDSPSYNTLNSQFIYIWRHD